MADIHPHLRKDCLILGRFELSHLLLMNDSNYPWFILVPDRDNITEIYQLSDSDRNQLGQESCLLSRLLMQRFEGDKLNVAAIGNLVPQLHLHHVVRFRSDPVWPAPVWGKSLPVAYHESEFNRLMDKLSLSELAEFKQA